MDPIPTITGIAIITLSWVLVVILFRTAWRATPRQAAERQILEYGRPMRVLGIFVFAVGALALYGASRSLPNQRLWAWILAVGLAAVGVHTCLKIFLVRVEFDDSFIYTFSPWRGRQQIPWTDILSCQLSKRDRCFVLGSRAHGQVRVPLFLSGIKSFVEKVKEKGHV